MALVDIHVRAAMENMLLDARAKLDKLPPLTPAGDEEHAVLRVTRAYLEPSGRPIFALALIYVAESEEEIGKLLAKNGGPLRTSPEPDPPEPHQLA